MNARYLLILCVAWFISHAHGDFATTVPISEAMANNIIGSVFPVSVKINDTKLFLTQPKVQYSTANRIGIVTQLQAYDHRPEKGIAISEFGLVHLSGELGFDNSSRQILLRNSRIEALEFKRKNTASQQFLIELNAAWDAQVTNLIRAEIPSHPYLVLFKNNIQNISYDGSNIYLDVGSNVTRAAF